MLPFRRSLQSTFLLALLMLGPSCLTTPTASMAQDGPPRLVLLPADFELRGRDASQHLLVHRLTSDEIGSAVESANIEWSIDGPQIVNIVDSVAYPIADGTTRLVAACDGQQVSAVVSVSGCDDANDASAWGFRNDVLPVLSRLGCNSGACHGALAGKGGFRLSLRGYDPLTDHHTITRQARGRRIELADPGRSLLLTKPTGALPHKGGVRLEVDSLEYRILAEWIAQGAPGPATDDPTVTGIEIHPPRMLLAPGESARIFVLAHFSDGAVRDVTQWSKFTSADESVARIDEHGHVEVVGPGEGAVTAWYSSQISLGRVTVPYGNTVDAAVYAAIPQVNFIDELATAQLRRLNLPPSPPADDAEFLRRVYLDTIGRLPNLDEARQFLADESPSKRDALIDSLLERPEFVDYWSYKYSDIFLVNGTRLRPNAVKAFYEWIHGNVERNTPWDDLARQLVTATGSSTSNGATNFYALHQDPESMTENLCQAFMGLSIGCAKCHNHPLEKWTNDQYYGMANLFARVRAKGWGGDSRNGDGERTLYVVDQGDLIQPLRGRPQAPTPLDGEPLAFDDPRDRREVLADWLTSPDNPYFARAITNRVWANYFGVGLIESVDDLRASNPASNEALLDAAADYLVAHDYDLKSLMREILRSATYQRSSRGVPGNEADERHYSRYFPKRLMAEVLLDAISDVTDVPTTFDKIEFPGADTAGTDFYPAGTRALELYDSAVQSYFLKAFGRNTRDITCECERSNEPSMVQVLHLANGTTINDKLAAENSRVAQFLAAEMDDNQILDQAFVLCLCRYPTDEERQSLLPLLAEGEDDRRTRIEDLFWSLMTTREFLFNH
ncbi:MAG: DUF1553 domain-containing protein [Pirellulaceae bacterium]